MSESSEFVFDPGVRPSLAVGGSDLLFPVRRVFCVGGNYASHTIEMGGDPDREPPFFFTKPADAIVAGGGNMTYPLSTVDLHHEVELVVALADGGSDLPPDRCRNLIFGYAVGVDFTRRDLQRVAKSSSRPWDMAKGFDQSAPCSPIVVAADAGHPRAGPIGLSVNGDTRQAADLSDLIWSPEEILAHVSRLVELLPGDLIFTGTPAGVGPVIPGDTYRAWVRGIGEVRGEIVARP